MVTPVAAEETGQAERERGRGREREEEREEEREREKERQPAILAAILNPSPCSPRHTTCLDVGRQSQTQGPEEARRKGGPASTLGWKDTYAAAMAGGGGTRKVQ